MTLWLRCHVLLYVAFERTRGRTVVPAINVRFSNILALYRTIRFRPIPDPHGPGTGHQDPPSCLRCSDT